MLESLDLLVIAFLAFLGMFAILLEPLSSSPLRPVLGLVLLFFLPGYALTRFLYPSKRELGFLERIALSVGFSIVLAVVIGLTLNYMFIGLGTKVVAFSLSLITLIFVLFSSLRRKLRTKRR
mgnify:CR=1 FL=1